MLLTEVYNEIYSTRWVKFGIMAVKFSAEINGLTLLIYTALIGLPLHAHGRLRKALD